MRVVVDTNVIISGLNFPGKEREVLDLARARSYDLYLSTFILGEVSGVLHRKFEWSQNLVDNAIRMLTNWATVIDPEISISIVKRNDADNRILECAIEARVDYIVTGDRRDLLPLKQIQGIKIVNSAQFISILGM